MNLFIIKSIEFVIVKLKIKFSKFKNKICMKSNSQISITSRNHSHQQHLKSYKNYKNSQKQFLLNNKNKRLKNGKQQLIDQNENQKFEQSRRQQSNQDTFSIQQFQNISNHIQQCYEAINELKQKNELIIQEGEENLKKFEVYINQLQQQHLVNLSIKQTQIQKIKVELIYLRQQSNNNQIQSNKQKKDQKLTQEKDQVFDRNALLQRQLIELQEQLQEKQRQNTNILLELHQSEHRAQILKIKQSSLIENITSLRLLIDQKNKFIQQIQNKQKLQHKHPKSSFLKCSQPKQQAPFLVQVQNESAANIKREMQSYQPCQSNQQQSNNQPCSSNQPYLSNEQYSNNQLYSSNQPNTSNQPNASSQLYSKPQIKKFNNEHSCLYLSRFQTNENKQSKQNQELLILIQQYKRELQKLISQKNQSETQQLRNVSFQVRASNGLQTASKQQKAMNNMKAYSTPENQFFHIKCQEKIIGNLNQIIKLLQKYNEEILTELQSFRQDYLQLQIFNSDLQTEKVQLLNLVNLLKSSERYLKQGHKVLDQRIKSLSHQLDERSQQLDQKSQQLSVAGRQFQVKQSNSNILLMDLQTIIWKKQQSLQNFKNQADKVTKDNENLSKQVLHKSQAIKKLQFQIQSLNWKVDSAQNQKAHLEKNNLMLEQTIKSLASEHQHRVKILIQSHQKQKTQFEANIKPQCHQNLKQFAFNNQIIDRNLNDFHLKSNKEVHVQKIREANQVNHCDQKFPSLVLKKISELQQISFVLSKNMSQMQSYLQKPENCNLPNNLNSIQLCEKVKKSIKKSLDLTKQQELVYKKIFSKALSLPNKQDTHLIQQKNINQFTLEQKLNASQLNFTRVNRVIADHKHGDCEIKPFCDKGSQLIIKSPTETQQKIIRMIPLSLQRSKSSDNLKSCKTELMKQKKENVGFIAVHHASHTTISTAENVSLSNQPYKYSIRNCLSPCKKINKKVEISTVYTSKNDNYKYEPLHQRKINFGIQK